jgi:hypothetical protein
MRIFASGFLLLFFLQNIHAQSIFGGGGKKTSKSFNDGSDYSKSQIWLGFKGGVNMSWVTPGTKYQIFQALPSSTQFSYEKTYEGIQFPGLQSGLTLIYNFRSFFSVIFEPAYSIQSFAYKNSFRWASTSPQSSISLEQKNTYSVFYLEFPVYFRMDFSRGDFRPYILGGLMYSYLTHVGRKSEYTSKDNVTGAQNIIDNPIPEMGVTSLFIPSNFWYAFGGGVSYDISNIRVGLNGLYRSSMNNIASNANRYSIQKINSAGDVLDDIVLTNIEISLYCVFPMKFLVSPGFNRVKP